MKTVRNIQLFIGIVVLVAVAACLTNPDLNTFQSQLKTTLQGDQTKQNQQASSGLGALFQSKLNAMGSAAIEKAVQEGVTRTNRFLWSEFTIDPDVATMAGIPQKYTGIFGTIYGLDAIKKAVQDHP